MTLHRDDGGDGPIGCEALPEPLQHLRLGDVVGVNDRDTRGVGGRPAVALVGGIATDDVCTGFWAGHGRAVALVAATGCTLFNRGIEVEPVTGRGSDLSAGVTSLHDHGQARLDLCLDPSTLQVQQLPSNSVVVADGR